MKKKTDTDKIILEGIFDADQEEETKESTERPQSIEDLDSLVRKTYLQRLKPKVFADIGVHLNEGQLVNYCLHYTLSRTNEKRED